MMMRMMMMMMMKVDNGNVLLFENPCAFCACLCTRAIVYFFHVPKQDLFPKPWQHLHPPRALTPMICWCLNPNHNQKTGLLHTFPMPLQSFSNFHVTNYIDEHETDRKTTTLTTPTAASCRLIPSLFPWASWYYPWWRDVHRQVPTPADSQRSTGTLIDMLLSFVRQIWISLYVVIIHICRLGILIQIINDKYIPGSPRPNKEWSLGWSM